LATTTTLAKLISDNKIIVSESGIRTFKDVELVKKAGVDAILVGEALMRGGDIKGKVKELLGK
jgi:indole-3-glycerol phosphate synthase